MFLSRCSHTHTHTHAQISRRVYCQSYGDERRLRQNERDTQTTRYILYKHNNIMWQRCDAARLASKAPPPTTSGHSKTPRERSAAAWGGGRQGGKKRAVCTRTHIAYVARASRLPSMSDIECSINKTQRRRRVHARVTNIKNNNSITL